MKQAIQFLAVLLLATACAGGPQPGQPIAEISGYPQHLAVTERTQWGWKPGSGEIPGRPHDISRITIHHGGIDFADDRDPVEHLRALQSWSRSDKDWVDIPYHFMIDRQGQIYETRPIGLAGDTNTTYDPAGHALVEVMGNYQNQRLSDSQLDALVGITAFLAGTFDVPIGNIGGHRDYADTDCPGEDIYRHLQSGVLQQRVNAILESKSGD